MTLEEMRQARIEEQQQILDSVKKQRRELTQEEQSRFDGLQREIDELGRIIEQDEAKKRSKGQENQQKNEQQREGDIEEERQRIIEITTLCREFGCEENIEKYIKDGTSMDQVRTAILEKMRKNGKPVSTGVDVTNSEEDKFRAAAADAILLRGGIEVEKPAAGAMDLRGMSLRDMAIETLIGEKGNAIIRMSSTDLYDELTRSFYNPTAAFPAIMDNAINKAYVQGYNTTPCTFDIWTTKGTLTDFKSTQHNYLMGSAGEFDEVPENGELKADTPTDTLMPSRMLKTYGKQFSMSRQAFINDDIGFLSTIPARYAAAGKRTINSQVYKILVNNPLISDGLTLFNSTHKNLVTTGTVPTTEEVQRVVTAMGLHKDPSGNALMIRPAVFIVPVGYAMDMYSIFNSPTLNTTGNTQAANPLYNFRNSIQVVEEPTLNALCEGTKVPWFCVANKADCNSIQVDYLNGDEIPKIRRSEKPGTLGFVWDIFNDWGVTVMDYRGIVKNPGVVPQFTL